jgi:hypothetical protein
MTHSTTAMRRENEETSSKRWRSNPRLSDWTAHSHPRGQRFASVWIGSSEATRALAALDAEIAESKRLLSFGDNWDGEGSCGYSLDTWRRATSFLINQAFGFVRRGETFPIPRILPGPHGSIDLHWKSTGLELLVNVPPSGPAAFFGDEPTGGHIRGSLDPSRFNLGLTTWLKGR